VHIVHVTPYYAPAYPFGGVVRVVEGLSMALGRRGHTVTVLTTDAADAAGGRLPTGEGQHAGVRVIRVRNLSTALRGRFNLSTPWGLRRHAAVIATAEVVHLHEFRTVEALLTIPAAQRAGVPVVLSPHGTIAPQTGRSALKQAWDRLLTPRIAPGIRAAVGLTAAEVVDIHGVWTALGLPPPATTIIPNGIDPAEFAALTPQHGAAFRQRYGIPLDAPLVLFFGRLHARKGADRLLAAFIAADVAGAHLAIVGADAGLGPQLVALAADRPTIHLPGFLAGPDRLAALAAADVFALPAVGEGQPLAALEALAAGVPVILSPGCFMPEPAAAGAGLLVGTDPTVPPTVPELADALRTLLTDPARRAVMSAAARRLIADRFTWEQAALAYELVYADVRMNR